jgi:hypothetical protein
MRPFAFALALAISTPAHAIPPGADGAALRSAMIALREARVEDAHRVLEDLRTRHPTDADVLTASGELRLLEGDYRGGARDLEEAIRIGGSNESRALLSEVLGRTRDTTIAFLEARSSDGRFVVRYAPGPDIALVPYALEALEQIATALERDLGYRMPVPVRLEIYPTPSALASVSTLTVDEIERTGTIALCKWDRLMVTSPRALVHGYPWVDTIGHEYVHLVLTRMSGDIEASSRRRGSTKPRSICWWRRCAATRSSRSTRSIRRSRAFRAKSKRRSRSRRSRRSSSLSCRVTAWRRSARASRASPAVKTRAPRSRAQPGLGSVSSSRRGARASGT